MRRRWFLIIDKKSRERCTLIPFHYAGHCYEKVKIETKEMQEVIKKELGISPVEQDVIVLYDGEKDEKTEEFWKVLKRCSTYNINFIVFCAMSVYLIYVPPCRIRELLRCQRKDPHGSTTICFSRQRRSRQIKPTLNLLISHKADLHFSS